MAVHLSDQLFIGHLLSAGRALPAGCGPVTHLRSSDMARGTESSPGRIHRLYDPGYRPGHHRDNCRVPGRIIRFYQVLNRKTEYELYPSIQNAKAAPLLQKDGFSLGKMKGEFEMAKHRLNKYERETILLTSEGDDTWDIYTFNTDLKNRLRKFAAQHPDLCKLKEENKELGSVSYTIQKSRVSIRLIAPYSEARRKAASEYGKIHGIRKSSNVVND